MGGGGDVPLDGVTFSGDLIDYNGVAISTKFPTELLEMGSKNCRDFGGINLGLIRGKKNCYRKKNCSAVDLILY